MAAWVLYDTDASHAPRRSISGIETAAEAGSTPATTAGLNLEGVAGFTMYAFADGGQTWNSATAVLKAWRIDPLINVYFRAPELDVTVGAEAVGQRGIAVAYSVSSPRGRIVHVWDGTGVTSGNVTVAYLASMLVGGKA